MKDLLNIATAYNDKIRIYACNTTNIVKHAKEIFNLWPTSCAALGRTLTIACIMAEMEKMDSKITIKIEGDGPIKNIVVVAKKGEVKGFCYNPGVYLSNNNGKLLVGEAIGNGYLTVIKDYGLKEPFTSTVSLQTGEIGEDFAYYFNQSEQTNTAVALGVLFDKEGNVTDAGGYVIQVMPNCPIDIIEKLEEILKNIKPISTLLNEGKNIKDIISILSPNDYKILAEREINYVCDCSKERFLAGIKTLGNAEINELINSKEDISVTCNFCNKTYNFSKDDLKNLID